MGKAVSYGMCLSQRRRLIQGYRSKPDSQISHGHTCIFFSTCVFVNTKQLFAKQVDTVSW